jgi:hypothetical protein
VSTPEVLEEDRRMGTVLANMNPVKKLALGAALAALGGAGIQLSLLLGWTSLPRPWSFVAGLAVGIMAGLGVVLAVVGLFECGRRREH